jgi:hypothetical protein
LRPRECWKYAFVEGIREELQNCRNQTNQKQPKNSKQSAGKRNKNQWTDYNLKKAQQIRIAEPSECEVVPATYSAAAVKKLTY